MSVTAFFVPDSSTTGTNAEELYSRIRKAVEIGTGCPPRALRIFKLAFRHNGNDLEAEVGSQIRWAGERCWRSSTSAGNRHT